jgi:hypothetical protein
MHEGAFTSQEQIMESQTSTFPSLKSKNRRVRLGLISKLTYLTLAFALVIPFLSESALAGPGKGGFKTRDLPANAEFLDLSTDAVRSDGLEGSEPYIDGLDRVHSFIGRREGQFSLSTSNRATSGRMLCLDDQGQDIPESCGDFSGCRVSEMITARLRDGGVDLRYLQDEVVVPLWINVYDDRQNLWHVQYGGVRVEPLGFDGDHNPAAWYIDTDCVDCPSAEVSRIIDNQYVDAIECGLFSLPFHMTVTLQ